MDRENEHLRMVEALLFASATPLSEADIADRLPDDADIASHIETIRGLYEGRGVNLVHVAGKWMFRTAPELSFLLLKEVEQQRKLSRAGTETLAIIAYHQPVTRAEIEEIRGVGFSKGTLDVLMEAGWVKIKGRRRTPGRPVTYGTSDEFLVHFGLDSIQDLPGVEELKAAGLLDSIDVALTRMEQEAARVAKVAEEEAKAEAEEEAAREEAERIIEMDLEGGEVDDDISDDLSDDDAGDDDDISADESIDDELTG